jgi:hypothetical protein
MPHIIQYMTLLVSITTLIWVILSEERKYRIRIWLQLAPIPQLSLLLYDNPNTTHPQPAYELVLNNTGIDPEFPVILDIILNSE